MDDFWTTIDSADDLRLGEVMPAWFAGRMMADDWLFGLLLTTGHTMIIRNIDAIHVSRTGHVLLDVNMATASDAPRLSGPLLTSPTERGRATVALAQVAVAFELKDVPQD